MAKKATKKAAKTSKKSVKAPAKKAKAGKTAKAAKSAPNRKPWSDADLKSLKTMVTQNTPTRLIAMKLKRTITSVYAKAAAQGISLAPTNRSPRD